MEEFGIFLFPVHSHHHKWPQVILEWLRGKFIAYICGQVSGSFWKGLDCHLNLCDSGYVNRLHLPEINFYCIVLAISDHIRYIWIREPRSICNIFIVLFSPEETATTKLSSISFLTSVILWWRECPTGPSRGMVREEPNRVIHNISFPIFLLELLGLYFGMPGKFCHFNFLLCKPSLNQEFFQYIGCHLLDLALILAMLGSNLLRA